MIAAAQRLGGERGCLRSAVAKSFFRGTWLPAVNPLRLYWGRTAGVPWWPARKPAMAGEASKWAARPRRGTEPSMAGEPRVKAAHAMRRLAAAEARRDGRFGHVLGCLETSCPLHKKSRWKRAPRYIMGEALFPLQPRMPATPWPLRSTRVTRTAGGVPRTDARWRVLTHSLAFPFRALRTPTFDS